MSSVSLLLWGACFPRATAAMPALKLLPSLLAQPPLPTIFAITPTYARLVQKAELTRIANTFRQVPALHWIVVEDANETSKLVANILTKSQIPHTQLCVKTPKEITKSRGSVQRNLALGWLRKTFRPEDAPPGVVYFADDDNTYSLEIFEEMRYTRKVSVWPVAFVGGLLYESIKVNTQGKVYGWLVSFAPSRPFAIDMAGFAISLKLILEKHEAKFNLKANGGYQEPSLLQDLVTIDELEPKAENCSKIMVWHTKTQNPNIQKKDSFNTITEV
ncbi:galactosylgalactosylxylosylprotein 3-beta-glucuronosyltransferase 1-like isoform 2-T2 [Anomaloglossus baeobatrachus]|uniref:galactosylgalactosylxylosylprotein 3-beta-glucuronosyltransferase 1-like isoform X2 n=1 Tax=Anomaloglossus baeobatrachus TaxID=238106 RepID=UPI003F50D218